MAMAEANGIVDSYLEGLKIQLARKSQDQENQLRAAESQRAQEQTQLMQKQFDEQVKQSDLARKAAEANFRFNINSHAGEYAQQNQPDVDPSTGQSMVDEKGIGTYSVQGPTGAQIQLKAPTRETQAQTVLTQAQKEADIRQQEAAKNFALENANEIGRLNISNAQAIALENQRAAHNLANTNVEQSAATARQNAQLANERTLEGIRQGVIDPSVLTGGTAGTAPDQVTKLSDLALDGKLSREDLAKYPAGIQNGVRRLVNQNGGAILPDVTIKGINHLTSLAGLAPQMKETIESQPYTSVVGSGIAGHIAGLTNPEINKQFDQMAGQSANIAKGIGGEEGQRLTNFSTQLTSGNYIPKITNSKAVNLVGLNNYINQIKDVANTETLGSVPDSQKARILSNRGLTKLAPYGVTDMGKTSQQVAPQGTPQPSQIDPNSFFLGGVKK